MLLRLDRPVRCNGSFCIFCHLYYIFESIIAVVFCLFRPAVKLVPVDTWTGRLLSRYVRAVLTLFYCLGPFNICESYVRPDHG